MQDFHALAEQRLEHPVYIARPAPPRAVTEDSPALDVMTDLRFYQADLIAPDEEAEAARALMALHNATVLLVMGQDRCAAGMITPTDLGNGRLDGVIVADVMTPLVRMTAIAFDDLRHACVGEVIATLRDRGREHALVIKTHTDTKTEIIGVLSLPQIERQLGSRST